MNITYFIIWPLHRFYRAGDCGRSSRPRRRLAEILRWCSRVLVSACIGDVTRGPQRAGAPLRDASKSVR